MSITINIKGTPISFPSSGESPNWGPAIIEFAKAVEETLSAVAGTYDVAPQVFDLTSDVNTNLDIPLLSFPTTSVRGAFIRYAIFRQSDTVTETESGSLEIVYDSDAATWYMSREAVGSDTALTFNITAAGQVQLSTTAIGGTYSDGKLTYVAQAVLQND